MPCGVDVERPSCLRGKAVSQLHEVLLWMLTRLLPFLPRVLAGGCSPCVRWPWFHFPVTVKLPYPAVCVAAWQWAQRSHRHGRFFLGVHTYVPLGSVTDVCVCDWSRESCVLCVVVYS